MAISPFRSKRSTAIAGLLAVFLVLLFITTLQTSDALSSTIPVRATGSKTANDLKLQGADLGGKTIMPRLGNETAKAELGRAAWKLLHTTMARFPDAPTTEESAALKAYIHLFQRLYPCGECAEHFRKIIDKFPPQVASRSTAAVWACHVHNQVNKSLDKPIFDCSKIGDFYDCGCAEDEKADVKKGTGSSTESPVNENGKVTTQDEAVRSSNDDALPKLKEEG